MWFSGLEAGLGGFHQGFFRLYGTDGVDSSHFGVQYAKAMGMRVIAIDGGEEKGKLCKELGAEGYIDFTQVQNIPARVMELTTYGAHGCIVYAAAKASYEVSYQVLRPGGTAVAVGLPTSGDVIAGAPPAALAMKRINIVGSVTGTTKVGLMSTCRGHGR